MFIKRPSARVQLQGVPSLRARRRAANRRDARRDARAAQTAKPAAKSAPVEPTAEAKVEVGRDEPPRIQMMKLVAHDDGWALKVDDIDEPAWVVPTKKTAVASAKENAMFHGALLKVHTKAGKVQKTFDFGEAHAS